MSVNIGLPRGIAFRGRRVRTGLAKAPVEGEVWARRYNLDGDRQGDLEAHGGEHRAVLVYQLDAYRHWERTLGRSPIPVGTFGENLTVDGLADAEVRIGDRYQIGGALFEVTQPRVTCFRVGIALGEPRMPALMVQTRLPGFYMRVLEEGPLRAGDAITRTTRGPAGVTVAAIDALLYLPDARTDDLRRALTVPALSPGWRSSLQGLLAEHEGQAPAAPFRWMRIDETVQETAGVRSLILVPDDGEARRAFEPGQAVALRFSVQSGARVERTYSISGSRGRLGLRVSVKRGTGEGSRHLCDHARVGDRVEVGAADGAFTLNDREVPLVLVSAGIGVTPVLAILHRLAANADPRPVRWVHGARDGGEHVFKEEVTALLGRLPDAERLVVYSRPLPEDAPGRYFDAIGRIDAASISIPDGAEVYLCGLPALVQALLDGLDGRDLSIHTEAFGGAGRAVQTELGRDPHPPEDDAGDGPQVRFAGSGVTARMWKCGSLLELAEACNVPVRWSCRTGVCHSCETRLLEGEVTYDPKPARPPAGGAVLICCARPCGDVELAL